MLEYRGYTIYKGTKEYRGRIIEGYYWDLFKNHLQSNIEFVKRSIDHHYDNTGSKYYKIMKVRAQSEGPKEVGTFSGFPIRQRSEFLYRMFSNDNFLKRYQERHKSYHQVVVI